LISGGADGAVLLWNVRDLLDRGAAATPEALDQRQSGIVSLATSTDGRRLLVAAAGGTVRLWDLTKKKSIFATPAPPAGHRVRCIALSPDGGMVGVVNDVDNGIRIFDAATRREIGGVHGLQSAVVAFCFSPDGKTVLHVGGDRTLRLYSLADESELRTFGGTTSPIRTLAFTPDGGRFIAGSVDGTARVWSVDRWAEAGFSVRQSVTLTAAALIPDGYTALTCDGAAVRQWDLATSHPLREIKIPGAKATALAATPDGTQLLTGDETGRLRFLNLITGEPSGEIEAHHQATRSLSVSPTSDAAITGGAEGDLAAWDLRTRRLRWRINDAHRGGVTVVAVSPDGRSIVSGGQDGRIAVWDLASGAAKPTLINGGFVPFTLAWSRDGRWIAAGGQDTAIRVWDAASGALRWRLEGHVNHVHALSFSPDGRSLASGGSDANVILWDLTTGQLCRTFHGHAGQLLNVAFDATGGGIFSASHEGTMHVWSIDRGDKYAGFAQRLTADRARLAANPLDPIALNDFGEWYAFRGTFMVAVKLIRQARDGGAHVSPVTLARCFVRAGKVAEAEREYATAIAEAQDEPTRQYLKLCLAALRSPTSGPSTRP
jgi:WD40 repeat protein